MGWVKLTTAVVAVGAAVALLAAGGSKTPTSAADEAPEYTTYFLAKSSGHLANLRRYVVSFVVEPGAEEVSRARVGSWGVKCESGEPVTGMVWYAGSTAVKDGAFRMRDGASHVGHSLLAGDVSESAATGRLRMKDKSRIVHHAPDTCDTGSQRWQATTVSRKTWRENRPSGLGLPSSLP